MGNITETDHFQRLQEGMDSDDDFQFTQLNKPVEEELLSLKNDTLLLCDAVDASISGIKILKHMVQKLDKRMLILENKINKTK
tara:strand:- start:1552 stop:1800 length:249 start_codon:yes stop_codon:yes gene_type:complete